MCVKEFNQCLQIQSFFGFVTFLYLLLGIDESAHLQLHSFFNTGRTAPVSYQLTSGSCRTPEVQERWCVQCCEYPITCFILFFLQLNFTFYLSPNFLGLISVQVKDVFLPWYNAYRFLVQNSRRLEIEGFLPFVPIDLSILRTSNNILDKWINSSSESLVHFVRQEMDAYRLYTVCAHASVICLQIS